MGENKESFQSLYPENMPKFGPEYISKIDQLNQTCERKTWPMKKSYTATVIFESGENKVLFHPQHSESKTRHLANKNGLDLTFRK